MNPLESSAWMRRTVIKYESRNVICLCVITVFDFLFSFRDIKWARDNGAPAPVDA